MVAVGQVGQRVVGGLVPDPPREVAGLGDVADHRDRAEHAAPRVADRGDAVLDRHMAAVGPHRQLVGPDRAGPAGG
ncbi:MAG TPA: hypothetical protein VIG88_04345, partial [Lysobacter sp.]